MPARHRHHNSTERRKLFTITLESCSRSAGIRVHGALEAVITMSRNVQLVNEAGHFPQIERLDAVLALVKRSGGELVTGDN
jgi:hypothetical protein